MIGKALAQGDVKRAKDKYDRPGLEWSEDWPPEQSAYVLIVLDHLLQQSPPKRIPEIIRLYADCLVDEGELIIVVPSLDWACATISTSDPYPITAYLSIYGTAEEPALCGFTISDLRKLVEEIPGLRIISVGGEWYRATMGGENYMVMQNVMILTRDKIDLGEAIT